MTSLKTFHDRTPHGGKSGPRTAGRKHSPGERTGSEPVALKRHTPTGAPPYTRPALIRLAGRAGQKTHALTVDRSSGCPQSLTHRALLKVVQALVLVSEMWNHATSTSHSVRAQSTPQGSRLRPPPHVSTPAKAMAGISSTPALIPCIRT